MLPGNLRTPEEKAGYLLSLYEQFGSADYIGEPVSQLEHMCQCAQLAEEQGYSDEVILAAFFHDIGHLLENVLDTEQMDGLGVVDHEKIGCEFLSELGFSATLTELVQSHVAAKRYLTYKYPEYYESLSEASKGTLEFQGGRMDAQEAAEFENNRSFQLFIQIRRWDEQAKEVGKPLPSLSRYKSMITDHLRNQNRAIDEN